MANGIDASAVAALLCSALSDIAMPELEETSPHAVKLAATSHAADSVPAVDGRRIPPSVTEVADGTEERAKNGFMRGDPCDGISQCNRRARRYKLLN